MTERMPPTGPVISDDVLAAVAEGRHSDPHSVLGQHGSQSPGSAAPTPSSARAARSPTAVTGALRRRPMPLELDAHRARHLGGHAASSAPVDYQLLATLRRRPRLDVATTPTASPRPSASSTCTSSREGRHEELWRVLGAHVREHEGTAERARHRVHRVGAERARRARRRRLQRLGRRGPRDALHGRRGRLGAVRPRPRRGHRLQVRAPHRRRQLGARRPTRWRDTPRSRPRRHPSSSSRSYAWDDGDWMARARRRTVLELPMCVYEVHLGSWRPGLGYRDAADQLIDYVDGSASRTSSSCRSRSTRSAARGATRSPATSRRPAASATPTTCATSSTGCTRPASA